MESYLGTLQSKKCKPLKKNKSNVILHLPIDQWTYQRIACMLDIEEGDIVFFFFFFFYYYTFL
jgi:hypothetical protein